MATISATTQYDVGDYVYLKSQLDRYIQETEEMAPFVQFYIPNMLYEITNIHVVEDGVSGNEYIHYTLTPRYPANTNYSGIKQETEISYISESNLYSLTDGNNLIKSKLTHFSNYLNTL